MTDVKAGGLTSSPCPLYGEARQSFRNFCRRIAEGFIAELRLVLAMMRDEAHTINEVLLLCDSLPALLRHSRERSNG
jgi:hypothetical protein